MSAPKTTARIWAKPSDYYTLAVVAMDDITKVGGARKFLEPSKFQVKLDGKLLNFNYEALDVAIHIINFSK